jgi:CMP-N-acetylneuraminic acid synthetase
MSEPMEVLAIIPARGGSKSIPRKNLRFLDGFPLVAYSIVAARQSRLVTRILLTTDDPEIRAVGRDWGAEAPFLRPASLAADQSPDLPVFVHALRWLEAEERYRPHVVVHLRPTSPFRPAGLVDQAIAALVRDPEADSVRSVCAPQQNPYKMWRPEGPYLRPILGADIGPEPFNAPRQTLPQVYWQTGQVDAIRPETILVAGSMTGPRIRGLAVESASAMDLDTLEQWAVAEILLRNGGLDVVRPSSAAALPAAAL